MLFKYIGTPDGPDSITIYGYDFHRGEPTEVNDDQLIDELKYPIKIIDKLCGNRNFEIVEKKKRKPKESADSEG